MEAHLAAQHSPRCPCGEILLKLTADSDDGDILKGVYCDICGQAASAGLPYFECASDDCDYLECPGCLCNRPIRSFAQGCNAGAKVPSEDVESEEE